MRTTPFAAEDGDHLYMHHYSGLGGDVLFDIPAKRVTQRYENSDGQPCVTVEIPGEALIALVASIVRDHRISILEGATDSELLGLAPEDPA